MMKNCIVVLLVLSAMGVVAQPKTGIHNRQAQQPAGELKLACPMENMTIKAPPQGDYKLGVNDPKIIISSATDTAIRSSVSGKVFSVTPGENKTFEVAMYYRDYYIWIVGVKKALVKKNDVIQPGQLLGLVNPGDELEFMLFLNDEPLDPRKYLECKATEKQ